MRRLCFYEKLSERYHSILNDFVKKLMIVKYKMTRTLQLSQLFHDERIISANLWQRIFPVLCLPALLYLIISYLPERKFDYFPTRYTPFTSIFLSCKLQEAVQMTIQNFSPKYGTKWTSKYKRACLLISTKLWRKSWILFIPIQIVQCQRRQDVFISLNQIIFFI